MGRWAQRRLRGSASDSPATPPSLVSISSVEVIGTNGVIIHFDGPANAFGIVPDAGFTIDGFAPETVLDVFGDPNAINASNNTDWSLSPGSLWDMPAQPNWLVQAAVLPESGVCV